jgi:hypothetical protein
MLSVRWVGKSGHWEAKIGYDKGGGKGVLRQGGGGKGEVWIWGQDARRIFARGGYFEWALMVAKARRWLNLFMES